MSSHDSLGVIQVVAMRNHGDCKNRWDYKETEGFTRSVCNIWTNIELRGPRAKNIPTQTRTSEMKYLWKSRWQGTDHMLCLKSLHCQSSLANTSLDKCLHFCFFPACGKDEPHPMRTLILHASIGLSLPASPVNDVCPAAINTGLILWAEQILNGLF